MEVFYKLILSFWMCVVGYAQSTQIKKFPYLCNIPRKTLILYLQINMKVFYKLIVLLWLYAAWHEQGTLTSFQYLCNISRKREE